VDLAKNLILLSGLRPGTDIDIQFTGLRPGEKLFEELNLRDERLVPTAHKKIMSYVSSSSVNTKEVEHFLREMKQVAEMRDTAKLVLLLKEAIPDYNPGYALLQTALLSGQATTPPENSDLASMGSSVM
jgi:FlaA1/EpsC-like NDP-sugar epimerase